MQVFSRAFAAMNTQFWFVAPGMDDPAGELLSRDVASLLAQAERRMSRFAADAELARVNAQAGSAVSAELHAILSECRDHWQRTGGAFDITLGAVNDNLRAGTTDGAVSGWDKVALGQRTVAVVRGVKLDLGGVGKGIALRELGRLFRDRGVRHALLNFGDSSVLAIGPQPNGNPWRVAVRGGGEADCFELCDMSLSTSGTGGERPHIVDPRGGSVAGDRWLSVASACPVEAEVLSTALLLTPPADRAAILAGYQMARAIEFKWSDDMCEEVWRHAA